MARELTPDDLLEALFASSRLDEQAAYLTAGRVYRDVASERLSEVHAAAFTEIADKLADDPSAGWRKLEDVSAEFRLRGEKPPAVPLEAAQRCVRHLEAEMRSDPDAIMLRLHDSLTALLDAMEAAS